MRWQQEGDEKIIKIESSVKNIVLARAEEGSVGASKSGRHILQQKHKGELAKAKARQQGEREVDSKRAGKGISDN